MGYQYKCACCNQSVEAAAKTCPSCGSHAIQSPFGFWHFCILTCLGVSFAVALSDIYFKEQDDRSMGIPKVSSNILGPIQHS
ncbi:hypothetical protein GCM10027155_04740 [Acinetobacter apis]|uniref:Uncharacterized protein n=1 Tax=Acinetobacter apis TaxID=1229165 RepID=A0A217EDI2_9GAMM|nr:hypothetical protein [Acinetobacter apis]SNQ28558.1 hypothetical protein SAMN05444584_0482 [Acinetobacter apis]